VFQLFSHKNLYEDRHTDVQQSIKYDRKVGEKLQRGKGILLHRKPSVPNPAPAPSPPRQSTEMPDAENARRDHGSVEAGPIEEEEDEAPQMDLRTTIGLLIAVTVVCRSLTLPTILDLNMQNRSSLSPPNSWSVLLTVLQTAATLAKGS